MCKCTDHHQQTQQKANQAFPVYLFQNLNFAAHYGNGSGGGAGRSIVSALLKSWYES
jgi:hypothetical protein